MNSFEMTRRFHVAMGLPAHTKPVEPTEAERILRAKLLFEETMETIEKGLGVRVAVKIPRDDYYTDLCVSANPEFEINTPYDPVETLDGLADVKVIANGTAVQFGLPLDVADRLVYESNMSKLDDSGRPIHNRCKHIMDVTHSCTLGPCELIDPTQPIGKILKGPNFKKPDIKGFLQDYCQHMASRNDKTRCGRCGITVQELR